MKKSYVMIYYYMYLFVKMKVFNYSELHFTELTSFKIHTLPINRLIGLSRIFSLIGLGFGHLSGQNIWPKPKLFFEKNQVIFDIENCVCKYNLGTF